MEKLEKYSSFDELKESSTSGTVNAAALVARQKKLESFIHFLRGDEEQPRPKTNTKEIR